MPVIYTTCILLAIGIILIILGQILKKKKIIISGVISLILIFVLWLVIVIWGSIEEEGKRNIAFSNNNTNNNIIIDNSIDTENTTTDIITNITSKFLNDYLYLSGKITKIEENKIYIIDKDNKEYILENNEQTKYIDGRTGANYSFNDIELTNNSHLELDYIAAIPRMALYMQYSTKIYNIYLKYVSKDDIYAYSIDEVFCDITKYLKTSKMTPRKLVTKMIQDVYETTGITATGGIGTNLYLAKIAMDIGAKHVKANEYGVRIAELDEMSYRKLLWNHRPLTDFWRVGKGYIKKLEANNIYTMGDIARCSIENEEFRRKSWENMMIL